MNACWHAYQSSNRLHFYRLLAYHTVVELHQNSIADSTSNLFLAFLAWAGLFILQNSGGLHPRATMLEVSFRVLPLWPTEGVKLTEMPLTVIFVPGLQMPYQMDGSKTTWTTDGSGVFWPQRWLPEDLGKKKVRVLSVSYNSTASQWGKGDDVQKLEEFGSRLREELIHV
ncbi:unnamed protein product [Sphagnum jensenii]|uniref:Uncharacterized protein n=1 Tax=Sphagnum jensenii TaxID=128206 RepID=A0ABP0W9J4_9BRYO